MIRATLTSAVDQALLSALNFALAILLIHFASKPEYGLYSELLNLQSFFSPFHAGIFCSAYLALASKMDEVRHSMYRTSMARAEVTMTTLSTALVVGVCVLGLGTFLPALAPTIALAFGMALLGLWWREFVRQMQFAAFDYERALRVDIVYVFVTGLAIAFVVAESSLTASSIFWCMALGGIVAASPRLLTAIRPSPHFEPDGRRDMLMSWRIGRWEVLSSVVSWTYAQSYVYFAALQGGLDAAAEISAGRLLATPLALMWASYANVLRPNASRLLTNGSHAEIRKLVLQSTSFVVGASLLYALVIFAAIPALDRSLFGGKFQELRSLAMLWMAYFMMTGITTVAASVLRSALDFRQLFHRQLLICVAAVILLTVGSRLESVEMLVVVLVVIEAISASLFWHRLNTAVYLWPKSA